MKDSRLTFNSPINLTLPAGIYDILCKDALRFGYIKNGCANISGFINHLIPLLSDYQDNLHERLLKYNDGNEEITKAIEQSILNVYLSPFNFQDDAPVNFSFRVNRLHYDDFILIHDVKLVHYDTDFTNFIRNLLVEYATKASNHRTILLAHNILKKLRPAIERSNLCHFYCIDRKLSFVPVAVEVSPTTSKTLIVGRTIESRESIWIELSIVQNVLIDLKRVQITDDDCDALYRDLEKHYSKEHPECLD